jgi:LysW-gamma-L-lysine carboxypeptidase
MDAVAFLTQFVRIPSPSHRETAVAIYLEQQMRALGFATSIDAAGNAIGMAGTEGPLVMLLGHIDTVPGDIPVRIEQGNLYGRGSVDAKGPFATFVWATARALQQSTLRCRVVLVGAVEEEAATSKGAHYVVDRYAPDYCVIGEPSGWERVTLGYKGRLLIHYRHTQPSAHSAGELHAAPEYLVNYWNAVLAYCMGYNHGRERLFDQLLPSLRHVASGGDGLQDWSEGVIGLRLPEQIDPHALAREMRGLISEGSTEQGMTVLGFDGACPAFRSSRTTPLARAFTRAIGRAGGRAGFLHKTGTSDMNVVGPAWDCPIVAYGPGDSRLDHTPDEHLPLDEYQRAIDVLADVLGSLG